MKNRWFVSFGLAVILLLVFVFPVAAMANSVSVSVETPLDFLNMIWVVIQSFGPIIMALIGLIVLDVFLALALAIRKNTFDWAKLANFYKTMVIPLLIGWFGFIVITKLASETVLGPVYGVIVGDAVVWLAWLAVVATLGASIVKNAKELYGTLIPFQAPEDPRGEV